MSHKDVDTLDINCISSIMFTHPLHVSGGDLEL